MGYFYETYLSEVEYLQALTDNEASFSGPSCILCDVRMHDLDGLELPKFAVKPLPLASPLTLR